MAAEVGLIDLDVSLVLLQLGLAIGGDALADSLVVTIYRRDYHSHLDRLIQLIDCNSLLYRSHSPPLSSLCIVFSEQVAMHLDLR